MINVQKLKEVGIDYEAELARFMDDEELYELVLNAFLNDDTYKRARAAFDSRDAKALFQTVHEAKGSSGNAGLTPLYSEAAALVALLRSASFTEGELVERYNAFEEKYRTVYNCVRAALQ